jgi:hypothetical protein
MKFRIAIAASALMLGTTLAVVPSFAQTNHQPGGTEAQQQGSSGCIVFQQGCSDKPYPMNNAQQTGTSQSRTARSTRGSEGMSSEPSRTAQFNGEREQMTQDRERGIGGTYRLGERDRYNDYAPSVQVGAAGRGATEWCAMRFRSYDPATGTYMGFDGVSHACP